jgi:hypothetical protein
MSVPTYSEQLREDLLGPSISVVYGRGIFDNVPSDDADLSIEEMNKQLKDSSNKPGDSIEFLPSSPMDDVPFEEFKKSSQNMVK